MSTAEQDQAGVAEICGCGGVKWGLKGDGGGGIPLSTCFMQFSDRQALNDVEPAGYE
jgi:hypothetical protein